MKPETINSWLLAVVVAIFYDGFYFVLLNLINPKGNDWTILEFVTLLGESAISIGAIYLAHLFTRNYFRRVSLGYRYAIMLLLSVPVFCVTYLPYWVVLVRRTLYGLPTDTTAYAGQLFSATNGLHIPTSIIIIISLYNTYVHQTEMQLVRSNNLIAETQLKNLQQQIDPHFLFNSLNILSALIRLDADKSVLFTRKLSEVYRFLLNTQRDALIPVDEEIAFVKDYFFLINCRFGEAFRLKVDGETGLRPAHLYIVPGTLQLLVENAIKHNVASEEKPITVLVTVKEDSVSVVNAISKKENATSGFGLKNLSMRYKFINEGRIDYFERKGSFHVFVPLFKNIG